MPYKIGQEVIFCGNIVTIKERHKGHKTTKKNMQSGMLCTGFKSSPCTYTLSSGQRVQGNKLKRIK